MVSYSITARQKQILDYLVEIHSRTGLVASVRELQKHFGFSSSNAVTSHLRALEKKGFIKRIGGQARSILFAPPYEKGNWDEPSAASEVREPRVDTATIPFAFAGLDSKQPGKARDVKLNLGNHFHHLDGLCRLVHGDALAVMGSMAPASVHAIVTDPPYGLIEYEKGNHSKLRAGKGGVWRIPPKLDGVERSPLPRFTVLGAQDRKRLAEFFRAFADQALRILVPGGHVILASNPLLSTAVFDAISAAGFEKRGEIIRLVATLRGGDRPKGSEDEFPEVSVMPRSGWEPWGLFRKPISERTISQNLRRWNAGGLRRPSTEMPLKDVMECAPARGRERELAPHPSLKPQKLMRALVHASLPLGKGIVLDPFAGSGSTLAAASAVGYRSVGIERDAEYVALAKAAFEGLKSL
jgi:site-specific DNA-methyltransferase (adenine-specific)